MDISKMPPVIKGSSTYKLIVPTEVEEKIRYLIRKFPYTEWSGVLFYTHQGSFEDNNLVIICKDIFPMDLGTSGWTEFRMSEDVAAYMAENIELFDCETGLVHSHHQHGAYFSGQDMKMVQQEGNDTNCFVSLVVDTRGKYVAIVTRKVQTKSEVTTKNLGTSYEFFGEGPREIAKDNTVTTQTIDKETIEYFDLDVERHEVDNSLAYLDTRFDEIAEKKAAYKPVQSSAVTGDDKSFFDWIHQNGSKKQESKELDLFSDNELAQPYDDSKDFPKYNWTPDPKKIHRAVVHILTCSLVLNPEKFDLKGWVNKHMTKVYDRIFENGVTCDHGEGFTTAFEEWKDFIIQYTIDYFDLSDAPESLLNDIELFQSRVARALWEELSEYADINPYIQAYCNALTYYNVE